CVCRNSGPNVNCDSPQLLSDHLTLARVEPGPDLDAQPLDCLPDGRRAQDRASGPVERCKEPVSSSIDLTAAGPGQLPADEPVMVLEELGPASIAQVSSELRRVHDVGEHHRRQHAVRFWNLPASRQEFIDLLKDRLRITVPRPVLVPLNLAVLGSRDPFGELPTLLP